MWSSSEKLGTVGYLTVPWFDLFPQPVLSRSHVSITSPLVIRFSNPDLEGIFGFLCSFSFYKEQTSKVLLL